MEWGNDIDYVEDELERMQDGEIGGDMDGWPQEGREHRWISVMAPTKWGVTERKELEEVLETYKTFSLETGSRAKGEIWVRNKGWEGSIIDLREHNSVQPTIVVTGWRRRTDTGVNKSVCDSLRWESPIQGVGETATGVSRSGGDNLRRASPIQGAGETDKLASIASYRTTGVEEMDSSNGQRKEVEEFSSMGKDEQSSEDCGGTERLGGETGDREVGESGTTE